MGEGGEEMRRAVSDWRGRQPTQLGADAVIQALSRH
jgi:hypothetical protein